MEKKVKIDDFISLGRAALDEMKDGRISYCVGGYSRSKGFVRIYPTNQKSPFRTWNLLNIPVVKDNRDKRPESWKIEGSRRDWDILHKKIGELPQSQSFVKKNQRRAFVNTQVTDCIADLNDKRLSLGIIKPLEFKGLFKEREQEEEEEKEDRQMKLSDILPDIFPEIKPSGLTKDHWIQTKEEFTHMPRIKYTCSGCKTKQGYHEQQLLDIGAYMWMLKEPEKIDQLWKNYRFDDRENYDHYFFVGNQFQHRTSFMVISVLWFKKDNYPIDNWNPSSKLTDFL